MKKFLPGLTYSLTYNFFDNSGSAIDMDNPTASILTPENTTYTTLSLTGSTTGVYSANIFISSGLTQGNWSSVASGLCNNISYFSSVIPFEILDYGARPNWLGLEDFRDYLEEDSNDRSRDNLLIRVLDSAMLSVEGYTRRAWGVKSKSETIELQRQDRILLKRYPLVTISGLTATITGYTPRTPDTLNVETNAGGTVSFYYRLQPEQGMLVLTDEEGYSCEYTDTIVTVDYTYGNSIIPEPVRLATLMLASKLLNIIHQEGVTTLRISDVQYSIDRNLFAGEIKSLLDKYKSIM